MKKFIYLLPLMLFVQCRLADDNQKKQRYNIVTTTGIIADGVSAIVNDSADVSYIMGPGTDPHIYKPTAMDVELLDKADIIITNGLHLEGKMAEMLNKYGQEKPIIILADGINEKELLKVAVMDDAIDPHIWFDLMMWKDGLEHIKNELIRLDSGKLNHYNLSFENYAKDLDEANIWIETELDQLPALNKVLITSHDAFHYFGRRYGIEVKGIQGISTISEVGLKDISNMVNFVVDRKINAIFTETSTSNKTAKSIQDGAFERGHSVSILGPLYADALGEPDGEAGTYIGMIKENVRIIMEGLKE